MHYRGKGSLLPYSRYIKKGNRKFGPYFYRSVRDKGKVKSVYVGPTKPIEEELDVPEYPKKIERKITLQQKKKELFSFYYNLSRDKRIDILLGLVCILLFTCIIFIEPTITGFHFFDGNITIDSETYFKDSIPTNTLINFNVNINATESGILKIIYPILWNVIDANQGHVSIYDRENYKIEWDIENEGNISKTYTLMSPDKTGIYSFKTVFNNVLVSDKLIKVIKKIKFDITDANRNKVNSVIKFYLDNELVEYTYTNEHISLEDANYEVEVEPDNNAVERIVFKNLELSDNISFNIEDNIFAKDFDRVYAIDTANLEFDRAIITAAAFGNELWKCKDWNFKEKKCYGEWENLMNIKPGKTYSFVLTPGDPAFGEKLTANYVDVVETKDEQQSNYTLSAETTILEDNKLNIEIRNLGLTDIENLTIMIEPKMPEKVILIHPRKILGWDNFNLLGWTIDREVIEPLHLDWGDSLVKFYDKLKPDELIDTEFEIEVPLTTKKKAELVLSVFSGKELLFQKEIIVYIKQDKSFSIMSIVYNEEKRVEIYMLILNKGEKDDEFNIEFNLNLEEPAYTPKTALSGLLGAMTYGPKTIFADFFGPYKIKTGSSMLLAQRYKYKDDFANNYVISAALYNSDEEMIDTISYPLNLIK